MRLYIPTRNRVAQQLTWDLLPDWQQKNTVLVCPPAEVEEHQSRGRNAIARETDGVEILGIAKVREWIVHRAVATRQTYIGILDDDLTGIVYTPRPSDQRGPRPQWNWETSPDDFRKIMFILTNRLARTNSCGLGDATTPPSDDDWNIPGRLMRNHFFNLKTLPYRELDWTGVAYAEDFHVTLQLIGLGWPNAVNNRYRVTSKATQQSGGCKSGGRNRDTHNEAMERLIELHQPWIRRSTKTRKGAEDWIKVIIRWKDYWAHVRQTQGR